MTIKTFAGAFALSSALALAACGGGGPTDADGDGEITMDEMRAEVASAGSALRPEAGKYAVTMTMVNVDIPGAPPEMVDAMGSMMNTSTEFCLSEEDASKGFEEALSEGQDDSCTIERFDLDGGKIDMAMTCTPQEGGTMQVAMTGDVSPTRTAINVVTKGNLPPMGEANIEMNMVQERIGDCDS
ncbi:MAG: DUF3617 domain-containing protein [Pseudomonadota bacterium]